VLNLSGVSVEKADGSFQCLGDLNGYVLLIVNVASDCEYTGQYHALRQLDLLYGPRGLRILAFPCNDFGAQEPGDVVDIQQYLENSFRIPFKLYAKVGILANKSAPYDLLTAPPAAPLLWNFEKFIVDRSGNVIARFDTTIEPQHSDFLATIERALTD